VSSWGGGIDARRSAAAAKRVLAVVGVNPSLPRGANFPHDVADGATADLEQRCEGVLGAELALAV
jgi:hypothetical protein